MPAQRTGSVSRRGFLAIGGAITFVSNNSAGEKKQKKLTIKIFPLSQWDDLVDRYERDAVVSVHGLVYIYIRTVWGGGWGGWGLGREDFGRSVDFTAAR